MADSTPTAEMDRSAMAYARTVLMPEAQIRAALHGAWIAGYRAAQAEQASDAERLDWLEKMGNEPEGLLLHCQHAGTGRRGLGLGSTGRTLRQAIDAAKAPKADPATDQQIEAKA